MTDKPTPEQIQQACDLANGKGLLHSPAHYGAKTHSTFTALADTIAKLDAEKAERDKARADLAEIDRLLACYTDDPFVHDAVMESAAIAAPYRVETDSLVEALKACCWNGDSEEEFAVDLRAELAKRGLEVGRSA